MIAPVDQDLKEPLYPNYLRESPAGCMDGMKDMLANGFDSRLRS